MRGPSKRNTYSEAWRHECEVRHVASLPSREARKAYIDGIREKLGSRGEQRVQNILRDLRAMVRAA